MESQKKKKRRTQITKALLSKKNKVGGFPLSEFKIYCNTGALNRFLLA
jgi:hypothetical protein